MAQWIVVRIDNMRIVGWGTGGVVPPDTTELQHVSVTDAERSQIETLRQQLADDGRPVNIEWDAGGRSASAAVADDRPEVAITLSKAVLVANGTDTVIVTVTIQNATPTVVRFGWLAGKFCRLQFVDGVATLTWRSFGETGPITFQSSAEVRVINGPVTLVAVMG